MGGTVENKDELIYEVLGKVGIDREKAKRKASRLSGGEQQRVAIARALAINPKLILADEPTGNLDSETSDEICKIFLDLAHQDGKCVIIVTHSKEVARLSDEIYQMKDGVLQSTLVEKSNENEEANAFVDSSF
ncbi:ATP-binding cassette domain-containing protein [Caldicellulosiruptor naganoensis]|uniref:ATP-binding cassette domain-containing protein n=1 Tax=Caldicellulosiruptor naganoensis TaxID=29324 RepID=A0ABY7BHA4_9FIRM|nr:ATP-binding cassette domain-containing protein [Caldicellulosiruptor naganoensis]WAM31783.1 ATP-binding cassette domain-containing protein [Caldicellulosiruptor naganoensis]